MLLSRSINTLIPGEGILSQVPDIAHSEFHCTPYANGISKQCAASALYYFVPWCTLNTYHIRLSEYLEKEMYITIFGCFLNCKVLGFYSFYFCFSWTLYGSRLHQLCIFFTLQPWQIFQRFEGDAIENIDDARFEHFATKVCYAILG